MLLPYDLLVKTSALAMEAVYGFTDLAPFSHDFENVSFDLREFEARIGTPGLHDLRRRVASIERRTILPPDLWTRGEGASI